MMKDAPQDLINGYFDDELNAEEHSQLVDWIEASPVNAAAFAQASLLHDRLRDIHVGFSGISGSRAQPMTSNSLGNYFSFTSILSAAASAALVLFALGWFWFQVGQGNAIAAVRELDRIIIHNTRPKDRTYEVIVEEVSKPAPNSDRHESEESRRPPKPPLDGAILHVRDNNQFVLIRKSEEGLPFVTGCNGKQSWAVKGIGPVKVSSDVNRFNRDLPGHESSIPLTHLNEGLEQLKQSYRLQFSTLGPEEFDAPSGDEVRMLVAVKKPRERGPQRVEISYDATSGQIRHLRFIQMPYGPDRLDLRLKLIEENEKPANYFDHESHHSADRAVEMEN